MLKRGSEDLGLVPCSAIGSQRDLEQDTCSLILLLEWEKLLSLSHNVPPIAVGACDKTILSWLLGIGLPQFLHLLFSPGDNPAPCTVEPLR